MIVRLTAMAAVLLSASASAQNGAVWSDGPGRLTTLQFAGGEASPPAAVDRDPSEMVRLFKQLCLDTANDPAAIAASAARVVPPLTANPYTIPATKKSGPIELGIWQGNGLVVSRTGGFFAAPSAQCNMTFYVNTLPDLPTTIAALNASLGSPTNAADAVKKNGKPNKTYRANWVAANGYLVDAQIIRGSQFMTGNRVQLISRSKGKTR